MRSELMNDCFPNRLGSTSDNAYKPQLEKIGQLRKMNEGREEDGRLLLVYHPVCKGKMMKSPSSRFDILY